jgi:hypothetical protein
MFGIHSAFTVTGDPDVFTFESRAGACSRCRECPIAVDFEAGNVTEQVFIANKNDVVGEAANPMPWQAFPPAAKRDPGTGVKIPVLGSIENPLTVLSGALVAKTNLLSSVTAIRVVGMKPIPCPLASLLAEEAAQP